jgi:hypothetical protein
MKGAELRGERVRTAIPTMTEKRTTWSIWPLAIASRGLVGKRPPMIRGISKSSGRSAIS